MLENNKNLNLIWIDLEMTGLNPDFDRILEIATLVTDSNLNTLAEGPILAIHQSQDKLKLMDEWNTTVHISSGLIKRVLKSMLDEQAAELQTLCFLKKWVSEGTSPICGNSIGQDRRFLFRYMPTLEAYFKYRHIDVSTLKELAQRWKPEILTRFKKNKHHKAIDDIRNSIEELIYYRENFIRL